jgi:hypothetical protein
MCLKGIPIHSEQIEFQPFLPKQKQVSTECFIMTRFLNLLQQKLFIAAISVRRQGSKVLKQSFAVR